MDKTPKRIVVALGGNALQTNTATSGEAQKAAARATARELVGLVKAGHQLVIVHGNGPQVGQIVLGQESINSEQSPAMALDTCGAMSQGEIGYWLQQALHAELAEQGIAMPVASVVTQTVVQEQDPAFQNPTKPIGPFYADQATAEAAAQTRGFVVAEDAGRGWRRIVPSPQPLDIVEAAFISQAVDSGAIVIAAGGGGVPVVRHGVELVGVEAVIDKDLAAEKLAELLNADTLLILTAVDAVTINFHQPNETPLGTITVTDMQRYISDGQFAPGSMLPKVQAAVAFAMSGKDRHTIITSPAQAQAAIDGAVGTRITA